jgi:large repetitive protein
MLKVANLIRNLRFAVLLLPVFVLGGCPGPALTIVPTSLPDAAEGRFYTVQLEAQGREPQVWTVGDGDLPPGLRLGRDSAVISGTPTQSGDFAFTITVVDSSNNVRTGSRSYAITVVARLEVNTSLPAARVGSEYNQRIDVDGGVPPYSISVVGLPAGLAFDAETQRISGTPLVEDPELEIQIDVRDAGPPRQHVSERIALPIRPLPVEITTTTLPAARDGVAYSGRIRATAGTPPYEFSVTDGVLPRGLRLDLDSGVISGTPTETGTFEIRVDVVDMDDPPSHDSARLSITVTD